MDGHRSITSPPGTYPATIDVSDGTRTEQVNLTVVVTREDATPTYTGPTTASAPAAGTGVVNLNLAATVAQGPDANPGDLGNATATFTDTTTGNTLCTSPVTSGGAASCAYAADAPRTYAVRVTVGGTHYTGVSVSDTTLTVTVNSAPPPVLAVVPGSVTIKGKLEVGRNLKARTAGWSPADVTYTYQWLRNGKVIKNATGRKYKLTNKDKGKKLQVVVTATRRATPRATVTSKKTRKVKE